MDKEPRDAPVVHDLVDGLAAGCEAHAMRPFDLQRAKQRLGRRIVPAVAFAARKARLMREVNQTSGASFLTVTHNMEVARRCDRIIELVDGRARA